MTSTIDVGHRRAARAATVTAVVVVAAFIAGKAARDAILLSQFGIRRLPIFITIAALVSLPTVLVAGKLMSHSRFPAALAAIVARGAETITRSTIYRAGYELWYAPLPEADKRPSKLVLDVGAERIGDLIGAQLVGLLVFVLAAPRRSRTAPRGSRAGAHGLRRAGSVGFSSALGLPRPDSVLAAALRMDIITLLVVGLVAGVIATTLVGRGFGLLGDIVLGIVGAFVGAYSFRALGWHAPFSGLAGVIAVAFVGAVIVLVGLRLIRGTTSRR